MSDINEIKKDIQELRDLSPAIGESIPFGESQALLKKLAEFQQKAPERFISLITTIESLQNQVSGYKDVYHNEWLEQSAEKDALIESQKEEIAALGRSLTAEAIKNARFEKLLKSEELSDKQQIAAYSTLEKKNESLKAITEKQKVEIESLNWKIAHPVSCRGICTSQRDDYCGMHMSNETCIACNRIWTNAHVENAVFSYKAITELAVKGLKKISMHGAVYRYAIVEGMADKVLAEIKELQNGSTS